ncbi:hypothetical protein [Streptomyces incanus]|uniref:hypothetical protein n=1 Tax=Streptomyces incanus TaxID=887453 RepID=UPI003AA8F7C4
MNAGPTTARDLKTALDNWTKVWNDEARPLKWTETADQILDRICRSCSRISDLMQAGSLLHELSRIERDAMRALSLL